MAGHAQHYSSVLRWIGPVPAGVCVVRVCSMSVCVCVLCRSFPRVCTKEKEQELQELIHGQSMADATLA